MKSILFTLALLISFNSFGQISILDGNQIYDKFPNGLVGYRDIDGDLLFDGEASEDNINEFKNHSDFSEISYYDWMAFEGKLFESNSVHIQYYCDEDGYPISMKQIFFKKYDEECDCGIQVGTMIKYRRDGTIKSIDHIK
tara:strand:+ start:93 stop:512 length:420 start_codon:yes stop_codon:yes gene_type:complete